MQKIVNDIKSIEYFGLDSVCFSHKKLRQFQYYLESRQILQVEWEGQYYLVDVEGLLSKVNLDCFQCHHYNENGCCGGSPCKFHKAALMSFKNHVIDIVEMLRAMVDEKRYKSILCEGMMVDGQIREVDDRCCFLAKDEESGANLCVIHRYALQQNIPVFEIGVFSCLLMPLEIFRIFGYEREYYYITSVSDGYFWSTFARWYNYHQDLKVKCLDMKQHEHSHFKKSDYKSVYQVMEGILTYSFGKEFYQKLSAELAELGRVDWHNELSDTP